MIIVRPASSQLWSGDYAPGITTAPASRHCVWASRQGGATVCHSLGQIGNLLHRMLVV